MDSMKFEFVANKSDLLTPISTVSGAIDKKQSLAILSNFLFSFHQEHLKISATDLELEISAIVPCEQGISQGSITVPAKKLMDIIRSMDDDAKAQFVFQDDQLVIKYLRSRFKLTTLSSNNYPAAEDEVNELELIIPRVQFINLLQSTHFALSQQDVRVFLQGLFMEFNPQSISAVATDGHRMAINRMACQNEASYTLLLPRKGVLELLRLLSNIPDETIALSAGKSAIKISTNQYSFISKLIDSKYPPYTKAIPKNNDKFVTIDCGSLKKALSRIIILANEKSKAVILHLQPNSLTLIANNQEQDEAVETLEASVEGGDLKIAVNASYVLDVLNHFSEGQVVISLSTTENSILIEGKDNPDYQYILMPMKL